jgi:O-antigen/teichoic acid export membrane protein
VGIIALTFILNPFGTVNHFFQAKVQAKYSSQATIFLSILLPILKLLIVYFDKGIIYFASVFAVESLLAGAWAIYVYRTRYGYSPLKWSFDHTILRELMRDGWPLLLSGLSSYIYLKIDQVMIMHMLDATTVGIYSAAIKLKSLWVFIPSIIIGSLFPALINARKDSLSKYVHRLRALSIFTLLISLLFILPIFIFAPFLIGLVFGEAFTAAAPILRLYIWTGIGMVIIRLVQQHLLAENLTRIYLYTSVFGAVCNVILNYFLIQKFGAAGAAIATLCTYILLFLFLFFFKNIRTNFSYILKLKPLPQTD